MIKIRRIIAFILFSCSSMLWAEVSMSKQAIALQAIWESPKSGIKDKLKVIWHDFKHPSLSWEESSEIPQIYEHLSIATMRERTILRVYENKTRVKAIGFLAIIIPVYLCAARMAFLHARSNERIGYDPNTSMTYDKALTILGIDGNDLKDKRSRKRVINKAFKPKIITNHTDKSRHKGTNAQAQVIIEARKCLFEKFGIR